MFHEGIKKMVQGRELFVSKAVQSAMIEVNECGTTAAAASGKVLFFMLYYFFLRRKKMTVLFILNVHIYDTDFHISVFLKATTGHESRLSGFITFKYFKEFYEASSKSRFYRCY